MVIRMKFVKINYVCILGQYVRQSKILNIIKKCAGHTFKKAEISTPLNLGSIPGFKQLKKVKQTN